MEQLKPIENLDEMIATKNFVKERKKYVEDKEKIKTLRLLLKDQEGK